MADVESVFTQGFALRLLRNLPPVFVGLLFRRLAPSEKWAHRLRRLYAPTSPRRQITQGLRPYGPLGHPALGLPIGREV